MKDITVPGTLLYSDDDVLVVGTRDGNIITYALNKVTVVEPAQSGITLAISDYKYDLANYYPTDFYRHEYVRLEEFGVTKGKKYIALWVGFNESTGRWFIRQDIKYGEHE